MPVKDRKVTCAGHLINMSDPYHDPRFAPFAIEPGKKSPSTRPKESFDEWFARVSELSHKVEKHLLEHGKSDWASIDVKLLLSRWRELYPSEHYLELTERLIVVIGAFALADQTKVKDLDAQLVNIDIWLGSQKRPYSREITLRALIRRYRKRVEGFIGKEDSDEDEGESAA